MNKDNTLRHSTDHVVITPFRPHGSVQMWMDGDILHYEATGPFNIELIASFAVAQLDMLRAINYQGPWVSICSILNSAMASPQTLARYDQLMRKEKPPGRTPLATAFVAGPKVEGARLMMQKYARIYLGIGRPFQSFDNVEDAVAWAKRMLGTTRSPG